MYKTSKPRKTQICEACNKVEMELPPAAMQSNVEKSIYMHQRGWTFQYGKPICPTCTKNNVNLTSK